MKLLNFARRISHLGGNKNKRYGRVIVKLKILQIQHWYPTIPTVPLLFHEKKIEKAGYPKYSVLKSQMVYKKDSLFLDVFFVPPDWNLRGKCFYGI